VNAESGQVAALDGAVRAPGAGFDVSVEGFAPSGQETAGDVGLGSAERPGDSQEEDDCSTSQCRSPFVGPRPEVFAGGENGEPWNVRKLTLPACN
jgi:hypothetical protein